MKRFDDEIEKAVDRAGKAAGWLFALGVLTLVVGVPAAVGGDLAVFTVALPGAGLMFGMGVVVNLLGMHLMETWRQGRRAEQSPADR
ncbi:hypothetical protein K3N28_14115 [Glycomyces sp. TRM65418]|uniref:hypothetical protein n=1 Tax=Glycomyces sp. TRM65418 TaxID=2867006 RepID=UPI001CE55136|nr:hypothetical protein [Glycomyces sp. TRM65418]MCC3764200.1 hypothetical protein [Glycomyces sp. TRM65418]QZD53884.1 hypothetical protein K3N28_14050 [Glycomyces sp. TRM65418]